MKSYSILFMVLLLTLSSFTLISPVDQNEEILLSVKKITQETSVNLLFYQNGTCSVQKLSEGKEISSKSMTLSESDLTSLKNIIKKARPVELKRTYTCAEKTINKTDATVYSFGTANKIVVVNNKCNSASRLKNLNSFIEPFLN